MKGTSKMGSLLRKSKGYLKQSSPAILTCLSAIGVVTTSVLAVKATPKACQLLENERYERSYKTDKDNQYYQDLMPLEVVQLTWKCYIPAALVGLSTIACIFGANVLNKRNQASLVSAYAMLNESYQKYRKAAKSVYGEDADSRIMAEVAKKVYVSEGLYGTSTLDPDISPEERLFYDNFSQRYFTATMASVLNAQYHLNRNFILRGDACLNEFYEFLGIEKIDSGDDLGWSIENLSADGIQWVDFENRYVQMDDGMECYILSALYEPSLLYTETYDYDVR